MSGGSVVGKNMNLSFMVWCRIEDQSGGGILNKRESGRKPPRVDLAENRSQKYRAPKRCDRRDYMPRLPLSLLKEELKVSFGAFTHCLDNTHG